MGYCTQGDIEQVIAQAMTSATASTPDALNSLSNLLNVGNTLDTNLINTDTINSYIRIADSQIDGTLSELYKTPFTEIIDVEASLFSDIHEHNSYLVLDKTYPFTPGDQIIIVQGDQQERHVIDEIISTDTFSTEDQVQYFFTSGARVVRVNYPDPVRWISARMSAANIYDKYFSSETSPGTSTFGDKLRDIANNDLNQVLSGVIILHGQHRIGRRFYNPTLTDQYDLPKGGTIPKGRTQIKS